MNLTCSALLILSVLVSFSFAQISFADVVFTDDFQSGFTKWTETGEGDWVLEPPSEKQVPGHLSNLVAHSDNCDTSCTITLSTAIDLSSYSSASLSFWRYVDNDLDSGEYLKVELYDGTKWNLAFNWVGGNGDDDTWHLETISLDSYLGASNFNIRFVTKQSSTSEDAQIDDVVLNGVSSGISEVTINDIALGEGNSANTFVFSVTRSNNLEAVYVNVATADSTATTTDYVPVPTTTLNFDAGGPLTQSVTVYVNGDTTVEPNETFFVNLLDCIGCVIADNQGSGTIINDDSLPVSSALPVGGSYSSPQLVTLTSIPTATIYYTVDGTTPSTSSAIYQNPIPVISNITLKFFASTDVNDIPINFETVVYTIDASPPVITINGASPALVLQGSTYVDAGATASDNVNGNITPSIIASNPVNTSVPGTYTVTYNVSDTAGNAATQVTRAVKVTTGTSSIHMSDTSSPSGRSTYSGRSLHAEYVTPSSQLVGDNIDSITLRLKKNGSPTGTAEIGVFNTDRTVKQLFATKDVSTLTTSYAEYTFSLPSGQTYQIQSGDRIGIKYTGGDSTVNISTTIDDSAVDPFDGANSYHTYYTTSWNSATSLDLYMILKGSSAPTASDILAPVITLIGSNPVSVQLGSTYVDSGATASDNVDGSITSSITTSNPVNTSIIGTYTVTYNVSDTAGNSATQVTRTVNVVDNAVPTVSATPLGGLYNSAQTVTLSPSHPSLVSYTTTGDAPTFSSTVYNFPILIDTDTTLKFFAKTLTGNSGQVYSVSYEIDDTSPIITLNGDAEVWTDFYSIFVDEGAFANDNRDGDITPSIIASNPVNTSVLGTYTVTYDVSDTAGNAATQVTRTVNVVDQSPPIISILGSNPIIVPIDSVYDELGATVSDNDPNFTGIISIGGDIVDPSTPGIYRVTYNTSPDANGNIALERTRTVYVPDPSDTTSPVISSITPESNSSLNDNFSINYELSEEVAAGTITFTRIGGTADPILHLYNFVIGDNTLGAHSISRSELETGFGNTLVSGTIYDIAISVTDPSSNPSIPIILSNITYDDASPITIASPPGGTYTSAQSITLTPNESSTIYYTIDNSDPTTSSTTYTSPIPISTPTTVQFFARDFAGNAEEVQTVHYDVNIPVTDLFGVLQIYPTKTNGNTWFMDMINPISDVRFDPQNTIIKNPDGSWKIQNNQVRMNVFSTNKSTYESTAISTFSRTSLASTGYMQLPSDWKNFEMTGYVKLNAGSNDEFTWYGRGGSHTDSNNGCEGSAYKAQLLFNGGTRFAKESWHVHYDFTTALPNTPPLLNNWVGFKFVLYDEPGVNFAQQTRGEIWVDLQNNNNWVKVNSFVDDGWGTGASHCGPAIADNMPITWGGPIADFRADDSSNFDFKYLSIREIELPN
jgi:hypothetical protein